MKSNTLQHLKSIVIATTFVGLTVPGLVLADGDTDHGHGHGKMMDQQNSGHMMDGKNSGHMMDHKQMDQHMQVVMGKGRINKVMGKQRMVNISHEPISELNWPKMRMNFQTSEAVDTAALEPGQQVQFTLQVDNENNYLIKEINVID